eukprot:2278249-Prymnesium_polylepis.1
MAHEGGLPADDLRRLPADYLRTETLLGHGSSGGASPPKVAGSCDGSMSIVRSCDTILGRAIDELL